MKPAFKVSAMINHGPLISSSIAFLPAALFILMMGVAPAARSEAVTRNHPNGNLAEKYSTDKDGRKHGSYSSYYESGKKKVRCRYSSGQLNGSYTEYHDNGKTRIKKSYKKGKLSGNLTLYNKEGSVVHKAVYKKDQVILYGGPRSAAPYPVYPLPREKITEGVTRLRPRDYLGTRYTKEKYEVRGVSRQPYSAGVLKKEYLLDSLRQLQVYRFLCGLKYDLELHRPFNELAQHAALVCAANRKMSHSPRRPPGMAADVFALCSKGAGSSNLHQQQASLLSAINGFMADEDASNIAATGHRAWCLNPQMRRTGLGECDRYQAMYAFDNSRSARGKTIDTIFFPSRGYYPVEYFGWNWPWSVTFPTGKYSVPKKSELKVEVWQLDNELLKVVKLRLDYLGVRSEAFGMGPGVIFRPVLFSRGSLAGNIFLVSLRWGTTAKSAVGIDYVVHFFSIGSDSIKKK